MANKYVVEVERVERRLVYVYGPNAEMAEAVALAAAQEEPAMMPWGQQTYRVRRTDVSHTEAP